MDRQPETQPVPFYRGIKFKMAALIGLLMVVLMAADTFWALQLQMRQAEAEAHEKATVLATQMNAAWDYVDYVQESVNRNPDGTVRSKNLVCVVAAKSIGRLFMDETDYTIRFVNENPRQVVGTPDEFEMQAIEAFRADPALESYWSVETLEGSRVFRYVEPLSVTQSCLECHGQPAGELDQFGFVKEGMEVGQVGGAMSIIEPMDIYTSGMIRSAVQQGVIAAIMLAILSLGMYALVNRLVLRRVSSLRTSAHAIAQGSFDGPATPSDRGRDDEIDQLIDDFSSMAEQLEGLYTGLEQKVAERTEEAEALNKALLAQKTELETAYRQLSEETAYKSEFFAVMSHELRTPLTSIMAFSRLLEEGGGLDERGTENVREIQQSAQLLLDIVNNFLIMSRAETNRNVLVPEPVDFVDLVGLVKNQLAPLAEERDIELTARADADVPVAMADWEKLRRILENLTNNAIKYTHRGGHVDVRVSFAPEAFDPVDEGGRRRDAIVMSVEDDGIGIAEEDRELIFDYYRQAAAQSPNRRYRGSGLGLAVVRELAQLHGGTVSLESELKRGSTFTVTIPYVPVETEGFDE